MNAWLHLCMAAWHQERDDIVALLEELKEAGKKQLTVLLLGVCISIHKLNMVISMRLLLLTASQANRALERAP